MQVDLDLIDRDLPCSTSMRRPYIPDAGRRTQADLRAPGRAGGVASASVDAFGAAAGVSDVRVAVRCCVGSIGL